MRECKRYLRLGFCLMLLATALTANAQKKQKKHKQVNYQELIDSLTCVSDSIEDVNKKLQSEIDKTKEALGLLQAKRQLAEDRILLMDAIRLLNRPYNRNEVSRVIKDLQRKSGLSDKQQTDVNEKIELLKSYSIGMKCLYEIMTRYRQHAETVLSQSDHEDEVTLITEHHKDEVDRMKIIPYLNKVYGEWQKATKANAVNRRAETVPEVETDFLKLCRDMGIAR